MRIIEKVTSPLKEGVSAQFGQKSLLLGPNGSGKTAVLQAVKLAARGYVDDQEGSDGVTRTAVIARLFHENVDPCATVVFSDGSRLSWEAKRKSTGGFTRPATTPTGSPPRVVFPFADTKKLFSGDAKAVKVWVESKVMGDWSSSDLLDLLPPNLHEDARKLMSRFGVDAPITLAATLKSQARNMRAAATKEEKTAARMTEGTPLPLSQADREEQEDLLAVLRATLRDIKNPLSSDEYARLQEEHEQAAAHAVHSKQRYDDLMAAWSAVDEVATTASAVLELLDRHAALFGDVGCYLCLRKGGDMGSARAVWQQKAPDGEVSEAAVLAARHEHHQAVRQQADLSARIQSATVVDVGPAREKVSELERALAADDAVKRIWLNADALQQKVNFNRVLADSMTSVAKIWQQSGERILRSGMEALESSVSQYLPEGESFSIDLDSGRALLIKDGLARTSLSGAEMLRVMLAVMASERDGTEDDSTLFLLDTEDRGWDPDTLSSVMSALAHVPAQVILMSTVRPTSVPPEWTVIGV